MWTSVYDKSRLICTIHVQPIASNNRMLSSFTSTGGSDPRTELDSHADTCVLGKNALIVHDFGRPMKVSGYDKRQGTRTLSTVGGVIGYEDQTSGRRYMLQIDQALHLPHMEHNLLCPMQLRVNDVTVNEMPKFLSKNPTDSTHTISIPRDGEKPLRIPLSIHGVISYFPTFKPTLEEYEAAHEQGTLLSLTEESPEWDPHTTLYSEQEEALLTSDGLLRDITGHRPRSIFALGGEDVCFDNLFTALSANRFISEVQSAVNDALDIEDRGRNEGYSGFNAEVELFNLGDQERMSVAALSSVAKPRIDPKVLAKRWGISLEVARKTIEKTTQQVIRTVSDPSLSRRFRTNDRQLRYRR